MGADAEIIFETSRALTIEELQSISYALGERFGADTFYKNNSAHGSEESDLAKNRVFFLRQVSWREPEEDGRFVYTINNLERYYGPGCERGYWPQIYAYIRFLRAYIPLLTKNEVEVDVWYGGDDGSCYALMTDDVLNEYWALFVKEGRESYTGSLGVTACPVCGKRAVAYGFSPKGPMYSCHGCGWNSENK